VPRDSSVKKVLVIGSGPIVIGQAAEFDYAGSQACKALREEGITVVLINSNPATIMTDVEIADRVYIEPLTPEFIERIIAKEKPDSLLPTLGGQTGLNLAAKLAEGGRRKSEVGNRKSEIEGGEGNRESGIGNRPEPRTPYPVPRTPNPVPRTPYPTPETLGVEPGSVLERYGVRLLGTPLSAIHKAEDRELFRDAMRRINEPVPESWIVQSRDQLEELIPVVPYPCIIRPAYTLGGTGGGVAYNPEQLREIGERGMSMSMSGQILVERSLLGWKELEYEVMRDGADNCLTVCNMENLDPMGVHTGDSIVVAPSQTLSDIEYQLLRSAALRIIRELGIEGGCNVQFAVSPWGFDYYVIEVNPRVSRSSALASKATGYPIARVSSKIAVGLRLDEIDNAVTGKTRAFFEPALDYCVVKIPRWPFDKFTHGDRTLGTQMKATGEVMAIERTFEAAMMKALRSLEVGYHDLAHAKMAALSDEELAHAAKTATDERLWALIESLRRGVSVAALGKASGVDAWFLDKLEVLVEAERDLVGAGAAVLLDPDRLKRLKKLGFSDRTIASACACGEMDVRAMRKKAGVVPCYKMVDTCAAEFEAVTPYYYSSYGGDSDEIPPRDGSAVLVLGSGPIRIGQGVEFDYCTVHAVKALRELGRRAVVVNSNPETVSTDFDISDALYFDPITLEDVLNIVDHEAPEGVIVQFGGQTAVNLARPLHEAGVKLLGTPAEVMDAAEDRDQFERLLSRLNIPKPPGLGVLTLDHAKRVAADIGYPVLVRPSFVLGGMAMRVVYGEAELEHYWSAAVAASADSPVLVDKFIVGREAEVDAICDGERVVLSGIMEHIEAAGIHSGDSMAVFPPISLEPVVQDRIRENARKIALELGIRGMVNIQFLIKDELPYVLEVNPRASRTVPYISKVTGVPMVQWAVNVMLGGKLPPQPKALTHLFAVKAPVFSFQKLTKVEPMLGPEMKSTGEIMGVDDDYPSALMKAIVAAGLSPRSDGMALLTVNDRDKARVVEVGRRLSAKGYRIGATKGTYRALIQAGVEAELVMRIGQGSPNVLDVVRTGLVAILVNTASGDRKAEEEARLIRRASVEHGVPCLTSLDTAEALLQSLETNPEDVDCRALDDYVKLAAK
jgi:carbamoyl-phosphate synthase large subunit